MDRAMERLYRIELDEPLMMQSIGTLLVEGDHEANRITVQITDNGVDADLSGCAGSGYFRRADGDMVILQPEVNGNELTVLLPQACYAVSGQCQIILRLVDNGNGMIRTVLLLSGRVQQQGGGALVDPDDRIPSLDELLAQIEAIEDASAEAKAAAEEARQETANVVEVRQQAEEAVNIAEGWATATATAESLPAGSTPTVALTDADSGKVIAFGIPKGEKGEKGDKGDTGSASPIKVNGIEAIDDNITVTAADVGAAEAEHEHTIADVAELNNELQKRDSVFNLLDNSNFRNPVNQRGESSYTGSVYGIDRWRSWSDTNVTTINDDSITLSGEAHLAQYIDPSAFEAGKTYTFAVAKKDGTVHVVSGTCPMAESAESSGIRFKVDNSGESSVTIMEAGDYVWAALYEGEYTTDTLPPYIPKGYAVELLECQRYYYVPAGAANMAYAGYTASATNARITVPTPVPMRTTPSIVVGTIGNVQVYASDGSHNATGVTVLQLQGDCVALQIVTSGLTAWTPCTMRFNTSVALSADL